MVRVAHDQVDYAMCQITVNEIQDQSRSKCNRTCGICYWFVATINTLILNVSEKVLSNCKMAPDYKEASDCTVGFNP